jgi:hypothetical protein
MLFRPNSLEFQKNNARNIRHMAVLIFLKFLDFEQVSVDSEIPILGQAPSPDFRFDKNVAKNKRIPVKVTVWVTACCYMVPVKCP